VNHEQLPTSQALLPVRHCLPRTSEVNCRLRAMALLDLCAVHDDSEAVASFESKVASERLQLL
jgi:hypothetical protein